MIQMMSAAVLTPHGEGYAGFRERCQSAVDRANPPSGIRQGGRSDAAWSGGGAACAGQAGRRRLLEEVRRSGARKATAGPDAAYSQDFLYSEDGLPA